MIVNHNIHYADGDTGDSVWEGYVKSYGNSYDAKKESRLSFFLCSGDRLSPGVIVEAKYHSGSNEPPEHKMAGGNGGGWK